MAKSKRGRSDKRQRGEFLTPPLLAKEVLGGIDILSSQQILEPSFGDGSFLFAVIDILEDHGYGVNEIHEFFATRVHGTEINPALFKAFSARYQERIGANPPSTLKNDDFFKISYYGGQFDLIIGNPPFGGVFDVHIEDLLDSKYGRWNGRKLKKETYSFFVARCLDWLAENGELRFICSDTFMTISTMSGLRRRLMDQCENTISSLDFFSEEITVPTLILKAVKKKSNTVRVNDSSVDYESVEKTQNLSWAICDETLKYFQGPLVGEYLLASSGMTTGNNELFVKDINDQGFIVERYRYEYFQEPITLEGETKRARLGKLSPRKVAEIRSQERNGETRKSVRAIELASPLLLKLPNPAYRFYNKATSERFFSRPRYAIYWENNGEAVITFKKSGPWYLHGVGGAKFFGKEGLTWSLVSSRFAVRYLPAGYILDSGAPIGILRDGIDKNELYFLIAWLNTDLARQILKTVVNHTRNIQSKDVERLPYPFWVSNENKLMAIDIAKDVIQSMVAGSNVSPGALEVITSDLNELFSWREVLVEQKISSAIQLELVA